MTNDFASAVFGKTTARAIVAGFSSGTEARYTMNIFGLLKTDPEVEYIYDAETGEILYSRT
jgi:hypothetical protein